MPIFTLLIDRIHWILKWYYPRISHEAYRDHAADPQRGAVWLRMFRLIHRLIALANKYQAGTLPIARPRRPRTTARPAPATPRIRPPRSSIWLNQQFPDTIPPLSGAIWLLCNDPEVMALVAAAPQAARILRPLCQMLRLEPPPHLQLPPRPRRPRPKAARKPRPPRQVDITRMSSVAWGRLVHPDHPGHPPARIGYARSRNWPKRE